METFYKLIPPASVSTVLIVFVAISLLYLRAGSIYLPLARISRLIIGKIDINHEGIRSYLQQRQEVEVFNLASGLRAENIKDVQRFLTWHQTTGISLVRMKRAGAWFDRESLTIRKQPRWFHLVGHLSWIVPTTVALALMITLVSRNEVLVWTKRSNQFLWYSEAGFHTFFDENWKLNKNSCSSSAIQDGGALVRCGRARVVMQGHRQHRFRDERPSRSTKSAKVCGTTHSRAALDGVLRAPRFGQL